MTRIDELRLMTKIARLSYLVSSGENHATQKPVLHSSIAH